VTGLEKPVKETMSSKPVLLKLFALKVGCMLLLYIGGRTAKVFVGS
jgi:hypothetical protein